ncbi:cupin domain-containing protein [Plantactinospora sp. GCM10030261]|uniref:cupin domain-containing protein n=1 Tax=Plantactinospora sp. GCM10030261 TaxID=3273420 RepID=UPI00360F36A3
MRVVTDTQTTTTPNGQMTTLAAPSVGSRELSLWRVRMAAGARGPLHTIDREQVFMPLAGSFTITVAGTATTVGTGTTAILPAGAQRQVAVLDGPAEALVCMPSAGRVTVPDEPASRPLPWAA